MAYILKKAAGGGGGTATDTNQTIQITQLQDLTGVNSVFKDNGDISIFADNTNKSVFKDNSGSTVFINNSNQSVADIATQSDLTLSGIGQILLDTLQTANSTLVQTFTSTTLAGAAALLQTSLQASPAKRIINISFSSAGPTQHDIILVYKP